MYTYIYIYISVTASRVSTRSTEAPKHARDCVRNDVPLSFSLSLSIYIYIYTSITYYNTLIITLLL